MSQLIERLKSEFEGAGLLLDDQIGERYAADWSEMAAEKPIAVMRPNSTEQLAKMLVICNELAQPVVIQGGMTGLAGAATPFNGEVALTLERMSGVEEIDPDSMTMTVLAGTPLQEAQERARAAGLYLPLDLGARGSCTIGGNVSTNAGGNQVIRYGMTRDLVLGLEAVLADGKIISSLNKLIKNNTGYDLKQLFIGSEGTLGVVTRVVLRLQPLLPRTYTALCAAGDFSNVIDFLKLAQSELAGGVCAFEVMWANYYDYIVKHVDTIKNPFNQKHELYVIVQYQGADNSAIKDMFEGLLFSALEKEQLKDVLVAQSNREADAFWKIRDGIGDVLPLVAPAVNFDIGIPIKRMQSFAAEIENKLEQKFMQATPLLFGHVGDGNLHLTVCLNDVEDSAAVSRLVYDQVCECSGSISAEHGIGKLKKKYLSLSRSAEELDLMRALKLTLDPKRILNPDRIF